jgi:hypothetical protein
MTNIPEFVADLCAAAPALTHVLDEHVADNDQFLPHVFMADVTRWLGADRPATAVRAVVAVIADHFDRGQPDVRDVILASFLENLERDDPADQAVLDALPPALIAARRDIGRDFPNRPDHRI